ncbi:MAG: hypothetical protein AB1529_08385 [Candidatus Micrarchaeota archaeon]
MDIPKCSHCAMPVESSNIHLRGMLLKCRYCGYSGLPLNAGACFYDKIEIERPEPYDAFRGEFGPRSVLSHLALLSLFSAMLSLWWESLGGLTLALFSGFALFSALYVFARLKRA